MPPVVLADRTSFLTIRPRGPVPFRAFKSTPFSLARRRAKGEATTLSEEATTAEGAGEGAVDAETGAAGATGAGSDEGVLTEMERESAVSPSSRSMAMGVLTATPSDPAGINRAPMVPSSTASTSMVALSVSISAKI